MTATAIRSAVAELVAQRELPTFTGRCSYCGCRCYGLVCANHRDLLLIEQQMQRGPASERRTA